MSKIQFKKAERAIKNITDIDDLQQLSRLINEQIANAIGDSMNAKTPLDWYSAGYLAGVQGCSDYHWDYVHTAERIYTGLYGLRCYIAGIATAGFGEIVKATLRELGGQLADTATQLEFAVDDLAKHSGNGAKIELDLSEEIAMKDALKAMYTDDDPGGNQLRTIAAQLNPMTQKNILEIRPQFVPGRRRGMSEWRWNIYMRWVAIENQHPELQAGEVLTKLLDEYKSDKTPDQKAIQNLQENRGKASDYRHRLMRDTAQHST